MENTEIDKRIAEIEGYKKCNISEDEDGGLVRRVNGWYSYYPSTDWSQGGPLIEKYFESWKIHKIRLNDFTKQLMGYNFVGYTKDDGIITIDIQGKTHLQTAMLAIIKAHKE